MQAPGDWPPICRVAPSLAFFFAVLISAFCPGQAEEPPARESPSNKDSRLLPEWNELIPDDLKREWTMKTLGGRQFWGDVAVFHDWTIQKNVFTGHYRLLDGADVRHASGTLEECRKRLDEIKKARELPPMDGPAVILIHGIFRTSKSFSKLADRLTDEGYLAVRFEYPSTRIGIPRAAESLHRVIASLEGIDEIHFVVHSMGGLVVRAYLDRYGDERIQRMVMLAVPNNGADMADRLQKNFFYKTVLGPAGQQLVSDPEGFIADLPTPDFEFAVIAGARGTEDGYNPLVPGDDDGTVSVESTRLPGAADFMTVPALHSFLMNNEQVVESTVRFLETGRLRKEGDPQPIPRIEKQMAEQNGRPDAGKTGRPKAEKSTE